MKECTRLYGVQPYMFSELDGLKSELLTKGYDIIDMSIGDPDLPTPEFIIEALKEGARDEKNHRYPPYEGTIEFRKSVAAYYKRRFGVELDVNEEIVALIGSKEGIAHLSLALIDKDDTAIVPDPAYPIYKTSVKIAGGIPYILPLRVELGFMPDVKEIEESTAKKAKLMYINYPNNPTGALASEKTLSGIIDFAMRNHIVLCNDAAYSEIVFDRKSPLSILAIPGSKETCVELGTLSKSYNMTGWRIGYAVGSRDVLKKLMTVKINTDSGQFGAIQHAGSRALDNGDSFIEYMRMLYLKRRNFALKALREIGMETYVPGGGFYIWFKVPFGYRSEEFAYRLMKDCGVIVTPGSAFGAHGEGYLRIALTVNETKFEMAVLRMKNKIT